MNDIRTFRLPDLGEGLPDATIVEWLVPVGATIALDAPLISMETAKAIVEVPSPYAGKLVKVYGRNGDVIETGAALVDFEIDTNTAQRSENAAAGTHHATTAQTSAQSELTARVNDGAMVSRNASAPSAEKSPEDAGTVVGTMPSSDRLVSETLVSIGGVRAMPAVRALARKLDVDLSTVRPSGADGVATIRDVRAAADNPQRQRQREPWPPTRQQREARSVSSESGPAAATQPDAASSAPSERGGFAGSSEFIPDDKSKPGFGTAEPLKGVRRNMARVMADAQAKVALTTIFDDADIHAWPSDSDISVRLLRSIVAACKAVPACNAWFDGDALTRTLHSQVDIGIAVDTADGLFVPALRNADLLDAKQLRTTLDALLRQVRERSIAAQELTGYTISLSNFGVFAGRYATPIVVPPCVAIVAAGKLRHEVVPVLGGIETHRLMPISLSFDHRAVTGGEAARFLQALLTDLALGN